MPLSRLEYLFDNYIHFKCSPEEEKELMEMIAQSQNRDTIQALIDGAIHNMDIERRMPDELAASVLQKILETEREKALVVPIRKKNILWLRVAAAVVILFGIASFWIFEGKEENLELSKVEETIEKQMPILPGGNRAILTMADGNTIVLDSIPNGTLQHGNTKINKQGGLLVYDASAIEIQNAAVRYNTLSTPRGGQYQVVLPDGSKVWLNAASSLKFPTAFVGNQREVELIGEAYFEVAPLTSKVGPRVPFIVSVVSLSGESRTMKIEVLGTHFNVNAYEDEGAIKTSLLEGSVKVIRGNQSELLKPGKQAVVDKKQDKINVSSVDMGGVMAWKNGLFQFEGAGIASIMREIGRWYNVEINFSGRVSDRVFEGKISRDAQLSDVLKILELSGVKFTVVGRKIIVQ